MLAQRDLDDSSLPAYLELFVTNSSLSSFVTGTVVEECISGAIAVQYV
jgi:hypothetical protein